MKKKWMIMVMGLLLTIGVSGQQKPPVAVDDSVVAYAGSILHINVLENDYWMEGHVARIFAINIPTYIATFNDSVITYTTKFDDTGVKILHYVIEDTDNGLYSDIAVLKIKIISNAYNTLAVNNLNASFNARGNHHRSDELRESTDFLVFDDGLQRALIENMSLWIGGRGEDGQVHMAAETGWEDNHIDFWMGPVSDNYDVDYFMQWSRIWKITRTEIEYHKANWNDPFYQLPAELATWPAGGDHSKRETEAFAPYYDHNGDGIYNPMSGDYPLIRGDEALFFVYNDDVMQHTSGGQKLGIEIRGMAYVFHCNGSEALENAVFVHYDIINKSANTYHDAYIGVYANMAIGDGGDDFIECDVMRNSFFGFDGDSSANLNDPNHKSGSFCPAQSITILGGPWMDADGMDNARLDQFGNPFLGEGLNGLNFGDGIADNERLGMKTFISYGIDKSGSYCQQPSSDEDYYLNMQGYWKDGTHIEYGGKGHHSAGSVGPACHYLMPGESDPYLWGTLGVAPLGGYLQGGKYWTEIMEGNEPHHISSVASMGPFTFGPGGMQELDLVMVFGQDFTKSGSAYSIPVMKERIDSIRYYFENHLFPGDDGPAAVQDADENQEPFEFQLYPNPCTEVVKIRCRIPDACPQPSRGTGSRMVELFSTDGKLCRKMLLDKYETNIDLSDLPNGLYIVLLTAGNMLKTQKLMIKHQ